MTQSLTQSSPAHLYYPFLTALGSKNFSIPPSTLWAVEINLASLREIMLKVIFSGACSVLVPPYNFGDYTSSKYVDFLDPGNEFIWGRGSGANAVHGCIFASAVMLPNEQILAERASSGRYGMVYPAIVKERSIGALAITFLETNASIINSIFLPWIIAHAHYGRVARPAKSSRNFKLDEMKVILLQKSSEASQKNKEVFKPRLQYKFFNVAPIRTDTLSLDYSNDAPKNIVVEFAFDNYRTDDANLK